MYANFGYWGGIAGCGIYALVLGLLCRWIAIRARSSPFWWAIAAYAGHWALKAESDVGSVLNYVTKASLIVFAVTLCLPALRAELRGESRKKKAESRKQRAAGREEEADYGTTRRQDNGTRDQRSEGRGQKAEGRSKR